MISIIRRIRMYLFRYFVVKDLRVDEAMRYEEAGQTHRCKSMVRYTLRNANVENAGLPLAVSLVC